METLVPQLVLCQWVFVSAVGMQEVNRTSQEHIAANAEKIRELGFKIRTLKIPE